MDQTVYDESTMAALQQWTEDFAPGLFPNECALAVQRYDRPDIALPISDEPALTQAVEKRRREFSAGRVAAGLALRKLGLANHRIPIGPDRNPVWPAGISGSITHTAGLAVAVVARCENAAALGIDLELADSVKPELWRGILDEKEIAWISTFPPERQTHWATVIFCAKESFYKMQHPLTRSWVDFQEAQVVITPESGEFQLECLESKVANQLARSTFFGRFIAGPHLVFAAMYFVGEVGQSAR